jgi:hypothetical protein
MSKITSSYPADWRTRASSNPWWVAAHGTRRAAIRHVRKGGAQEGPLLAPVWYVRGCDLSRRPGRIVVRFPTTTPPRRDDKTLWRDERGWHEGEESL